MGCACNCWVFIESDKIVLRLYNRITIAVCNGYIFQILDAIVMRFYHRSAICLKQKGCKIFPFIVLRYPNRNTISKVKVQVFDFTIVLRLYNRNAML